MTLAAQHTAPRSTKSPVKRHRAAALLLGVLAFLMAVLVVLPDGFAEPVQAGICWVIVAIAAAVAVVVVAKGLERFLDSEAD